MHHVELKQVRAGLGCLALLTCFGVKSVQAQSITPAADGTGTIVSSPQANQIDISGGTQSGNNLFQSFQQFGLNPGQIANFTSAPTIQNILGRVVGGDASVINGMIQVTGSNANLYLVNPAGIVFGTGASLNVPASFTATTANAVGFGQNQWFNAVGANNYAALGGNPTGFAMLGNGSLVNAGNLAVGSGQSITLVGGTVINTGTITAPGGDITIVAAPGEKFVRVGQVGSLLSLDLPVESKTAINAPTVTPVSLPALLTGNTLNHATGITIENGVVRLTSTDTTVPLTAGSAAIGGTLNADAIGTGNGGKVIAYADQTLNFAGNITARGGALGGNGGFVETSGKQVLSVAPTAQVSTAAPNGQLGTWLLDPLNLEVVAAGGTGTIDAGGNNSIADSTINAATIVTALNGNQVILQADNSITVNAAINSSTNPNGGGLRLNAPTVNLNQAITLQGFSFLDGTATTVNVGANGTVQNGVDVATTGGTVNLAPATYTLAQQVLISKDLTVRGQGAANTIVSGNNQTRVLQVNAPFIVTLQDLTIANGNAVNGAGGGITNEGDLTINNSVIRNNVAEFSGGGINSNFGGGNAFLRLNNTTVSNNSAQTNGGGISTDSIVFINNSTISGNSSQNSGGGISSGNTLTITNSTISGNSAVFGGGITAELVVAVSNSTITNNSVVGEGSSGGGILLSSGFLELTNNIIAGNIGPDAVREIVRFNPEEDTVISSHNLFGFNGNSGMDASIPSATDIIPAVGITLDRIITPLGNYGGPTQTHALVPGSPAINAGDPIPEVPNPTVDQRGAARDATPDIGAFESAGYSLTPIAGNGQSTLVNTAFGTDLQVQVTENTFNIPLLIAGIGVTFTTPNSGSSATPLTVTVNTNESGIASNSLVANAQVGTYTVTATAGTFTPANFALTNNPPTPVIRTDDPIKTESGSGSPIAPTKPNSPTTGSVADFVDAVNFNSDAPIVLQPIAPLSPTPLLCVARPQVQPGQDPYQGVPTCSEPQAIVAPPKLSQASQPQP
jgi:filamentous hemagglutinin family protein